MDNPGFLSDDNIYDMSGVDIEPDYPDSDQEDADRGVLFHTSSNHLLLEDGDNSKPEDSGGSIGRDFPIEKDFLRVPAGRNTLFSLLV